VNLLQQFVESQGDNPYQKSLIEKEGAALKRLIPELLTVRTTPLCHRPSSISLMTRQ
jgi:hypothetical protein